MSARKNFKAHLAFILFSIQRFDSQRPSSWLCLAGLSLLDWESLLYLITLRLDPLTWSPFVLHHRFVFYFCVSWPFVIGLVKRAFTSSSIVYGLIGFPIHSSSKELLFHRHFWCPSFFFDVHKACFMSMLFPYVHSIKSLYILRPLNIAASL